MARDLLDIEKLATRRTRSLLAVAALVTVHWFHSMLGVGTRCSTRLPAHR